MRELDELLQNYCEHRYANASDPEKSAFRELLALSDPQLIGYLLGGKETTDPVTANVVRQIRNRTHTP